MLNSIKKLLIIFLCFHAWEAICAASSEPSALIFLYVDDDHIDWLKEKIESQKISPSAKNSNGMSLLHLALQASQIRTALYLIGAGADINSTNARGNTPLHLCAQLGLYEPALWLLLNKAFPSALNQDKESPLHVAAKFIDKSRNLVSLLVAFGALTELKDIDGLEPAQTVYLSVEQFMVYNEQIRAGEILRPIAEAQSIEELEFLRHRELFPPAPTIYPQELELQQFAYRLINLRQEMFLRAMRTPAAVTETGARKCIIS